MWLFVGGLLAGGFVGFVGSIFWLIRNPELDWQLSYKERERTVLEMNGVKLPRPMTIYEAFMATRDAAPEHLPSQHSTAVAMLYLRYPGGRGML